MHEQPCRDLLQVNYTPERNTGDYFIYLSGVALLSVPLLQLVGVHGLQEGFGLFALGYYSVSIWLA